MSVFQKIGNRYSYLLESVEGQEKIARFSFIGVEPSIILKIKGNSAEMDKGGKVKKYFIEEPLKEIEKIMSGFRAAEVKGLPRFSGGLVGYMGYDMVRFFERVPDSKKPGIDLPDMFFMLADTMLIFDSLKQKIKIVSNAYIDGKSPAKAYKEAVEKIDAITDKLKSSRVRGVKK